MSFRRPVWRARRAAGRCLTAAGRRLTAATLRLRQAMGRSGYAATITVAEAAVRVEEHLREVEAAIPGARFEMNRESHVSQCGQPEDRGPLGRVFASASYWIRDVPEERNAEVYEIALAFWADRGFRVLVDKRRPDGAFVRVEAPDPDFTTVSLKMSGGRTRTLSIVSSSPCVWPDGVPAPKSRR